MSTPNETILIQVDIAANNARLVELTKQLNENRDAQKALAQAGKDGRLSADELAAGQVRLKQQAAALTQETRILTKANADQQKANESTKGSINQLRAELALGTAAYNALSQAERDNTIEGQRLQASNKALSDQLKVLEKSVGDTRRNVGNYKDDVVAALREQNLFGVNIGQTADNLKGNLTQGLNLAKAGFGSLKAAIISTGIGALVILLGSLYEAFSKTDEGQEDLAAGLAGLKAGVEVLQGYVIEFGKTLIKAFTDPQAAIKSIGKFLVDVVTNPRRAFNDFVAGIEAGFGRAKVQIKDAASAAIILSRANDGLEDRERAAIELTVKQRNEVERLISTAKDRALTEEKRINNLKEAGRIENAILNRTISIERERLRILEQQEALAAKNGKRSDEADKKIEEQKGRLAGLAGESATLQQTIANRISTQREAIAAQLAADLAAAEERVKAEAAAADKALDGELKRAARQRAAEEDARKAKAVADEAEYEAQVSMLERFLARMTSKTTADYAAGLLSKQQYNADLELQEKISYSSRLMLANKFGKDTSQAVLDQAKAEIAAQEKAKTTKKRIKDAEIATTQAGVEAGIAASDTLISAFGEETSAGQAALAVKKALAIAEIGINLEKQLSLNKVAAAELNALLPGSGIAYEVATDALAIAAAAAAAAKIAGFKRGGYVSGPGTGTSDSIPARLSNGESVMNANTTAMFAPLLSHLNVMGGGVPFATGGLVPGSAVRTAPVSDGGFLARQLGGNTPLIDYDALARSMSRVNLEVGVTPLRKAEGRYDKARSLSSLGS